MSDATWMLQGVADDPEGMPPHEPILARRRAAMSDKPSVVEALAAAMADVQAVRKDQRNREQNYNFRGIDDVVNAVGPVLRKHGIVPMPMLEKASYRDVTTSKGKPSRESTVEVRYRFYGPAGDYVDAVVPGEAMDFGDKGVAKSMSVAYRIVLLQALCIPTDEIEPDAQTYERAPEPPATAEPTQEQTDRYDELAKAMAAAESDAALRAVWANIVAAHDSGHISRDQAHALRADLEIRKGELAGVS